MLKFLPSGKDMVMFFYTVPMAWAQGASIIELLSQAHRPSPAEGLHTQILQPQPYIRVIITPDTLIYFQSQASVVCHLHNDHEEQIAFPGFCEYASLTSNHRLPWM